MATCSSSSSFCPSYKSTAAAEVGARVNVPWPHGSGRPSSTVTCSAVLERKPLSVTCSAVLERKPLSVTCSAVLERKPLSISTTSIPTKLMMVDAAAVAKPPGASRRAPVPLSQVWREIQGCDDWEGLVHPLQPLLREEVVRYGEFVNSCYKAFDLDPTSRRYLNCKYSKKSILGGVGLKGYEVTKYIYATPDIAIPTQKCCSRWIGYVAVATDSEARRLGRRDIMVTFRGTVTGNEWVANLMSSLTPARLDPHDPRPDVKVESGFLSLYTSVDSTCKFTEGSCREQLLGEVSRLIKKYYKGEEVSVTLAGHSMGSSLALLFGYDLAELGLNCVDASRPRNIPITVYSFAGPRVGNTAFKNRCEELGVKVLRVVNVNDPITKLPGVFLNENFRVLAETYDLPWSCFCYAHVGVELALDFFRMKDPSCVHDLDHYIRLLRCPVRKTAEKKKAQILDKAKELLIGSIQLLPETSSWAWHDAAVNVCNLVRSLRL